MTQNTQIEALKEARQFILAPAEDLLWGVVHRIDAALREAAAPSEEPVAWQATFTIRLAEGSSQLRTEASDGEPADLIKRAITVLEAELGALAACPFHSGDRA